MMFWVKIIHDLGGSLVNILNSSGSMMRVRCNNNPFACAHSLVSSCDADESLVAKAQKYF
jgi:hypothetical protein